MADYFTQWSVGVPLKTENEVNWFKDLVNDIDRYFELFEDGGPSHAEEFALLEARLGPLIVPPFQQYDYLSFDFRFELDSETKETIVYLVSEEAGDPEQAAGVLQTYLKEFHPEKSLAFEWACTCSKMRPEGFGGGAVFITAEKAIYMGTGKWVAGQERLFESKKKKKKK